MERRERARWCLHTGFGPDVYDSLRLGDRAAFLLELNEINKRGGRR